MRYLLFEPLIGSETKIRIESSSPRGTRAWVLLFTADWNGAQFVNYCVKPLWIKVGKNGVGGRHVPSGTASCGGETKDVVWMTLALTNGGFNDNLRVDYKATALQ